MATEYPEALDQYAPVPGNQNQIVKHRDRHQNVEDAIEAIEATVGVTGSTDPDSIQYRLNVATGNRPRVFSVLAGDGVTVSFPISRLPLSLGDIDVSIDGVDQVNGVDFNYSGLNLVFTIAPPDLSVILAKY